MSDFRPYYQQEEHDFGDERNSEGRLPRYVTDIPDGYCRIAWAKILDGQEVYLNQITSVHILRMKAVGPYKVIDAEKHILRNANWDGDFKIKVKIESLLIEIKD